MENALQLTGKRMSEVPLLPQGLFERYQHLLGLDKTSKVYDSFIEDWIPFDVAYAKDDRNFYDMNERMRLAARIRADGNGTAVDLGAHHGGMTYALKESGLRAVSTDYEDHFCKKQLKRVNDGNVVRCDAFHPPFRDMDAPLVSYMFLGKYLPGELYPKGKRSRTVAKVFDELSRSSDTIYMVELDAEYREWFGDKIPDPETMQRGDDESGDAFENRQEAARAEFAQKIEEELKKNLPKFNVEPLGKFGECFRTYMHGMDERYRKDERLGFRLTKKE